MLVRSTLRSMAAPALAGVLLFGAGIGYAQQGTNPYTSPEDVAAGGRMYRGHCASCHGLDGSGGGKGADLTTGRFRHGTSDEEIYDTLANGIPGTEMPGIFFNGKQLWQLVAFVRTLNQAEPWQAAGNAENGLGLFRGKGGCSQCHMVGGEGGRTAPPLGDIGASRSAKSLRASILKPDDQVLAIHWTVRAVTKEGEKVSGQRLNEDTFTVQVLDSKGRLRSLTKSELSSYEIVRESGMPSYEGVLSAEEVTDIVAYLSTLRRRQL